MGSAGSLDTEINEGPTSFSTDTLCKIELLNRVRKRRKIRKALPIFFFLQMQIDNLTFTSSDIIYMQTRIFAFRCDVLGAVSRF